MKGVSLLPRLEHGAYAQMPYEAITEDEYKRMISQIDTSLGFNANIEYNKYQLGPEERNIAEEVPDKFCDSGACAVTITPSENPPNTP